MSVPAPEFIDRPTVRDWKRHMRAIRWQERLNRAPAYRLGTLALLILAIGVLVWGLRP